MSDLAMDVPSPLDYFATLVAGDEGFPLLEAALAVGQDADPDFDPQQALVEVDQWGHALSRRMPADAAPLQRLRFLNRFFFEELGFGGNLNDYYDADNSYPHRVMATRRGIPITLAILYMELAQQVGLKVAGINFPGHFLVKVSLPKGEVIIDPFTSHSLSRDQLEERLAPYRRQRGLTGDFEVPLGLFLQAAPPRVIVGRQLRNLKEIHLSQENWASLLDVQNRLLLLQPDDWPERRDRALTLAELGRPQEAVSELESYLAACPGAEDHIALTARLDDLRRAARAGGDAA